jgi:hypothetical protein
MTRSWVPSSRDLYTVEDEDEDDEPFDPGDVGDDDHDFDPGNWSPGCQCLSCTKYCGKTSARGPRGMEIAAATHPEPVSGGSSGP